MLWIKAFHVVFVVTWFAALFYLPRLFVYHAGTADREGSERFKIMERKLYRGIMIPSMIATLAFGIGMIALNPALFSGGWLHAKLAIVALLVAYHFWCGRLLREFRDDRKDLFGRVRGVPTAKLKPIIEIHALPAA